MNPYLEAQAAALSVIVLYGLVVGLIREITAFWNKGLPPVGVTLKDFVQHMSEGNFAYWIHERFRDDREKGLNDCGVMEVQMDLVSWLLIGRRLFLVADYQTARAVLEGSTATKYHNAYQFFTDTTSGINIISELTNGPRWKHVRKSTAKAFSQQNIHAVVGRVDLVVENWIEKNLEHALEADNLDILAELKTVTVTVMLQAGLDYFPTESECAALVENLDTCYNEFGTNSMRNPLRQSELTRWMFQGIKDGRKAAKKMFGFFTKVLMAYRTKKVKQPHMIIDMIENDTDYEDDRERICDMIAFIVAGFDSTANTIAFALAELAANSDEQDFLRESLKCNKTSDNDKRHFPAVRNVIRETLRLHPAVANGPFRVTGSCATKVFGTDYVIPGGSIVAIPFYALQRNDDVFESPDTFRPERWDEPTEDMLQSFMPFSLGPRNCQGQALAMAEMQSILTLLIPRFNFYVTNSGTTKCTILHSPVDLKLSGYKIEEDSEADDDDKEIATRELPRKPAYAKCFSFFNSPGWPPQNALA